MLRFDDNATTSVLPEAWDAYEKAALRPDLYLLDSARAEVAACIGAQPSQIAFVRGGTEANAIAVRSVVPGSHVIMSAIEHPAVSQNLEKLAEGGVIELSKISVSREGYFNLDALGSAIQPNTRLVAVMMASNETGIVLPIKNIATLCRNISLHTDGVQAIGRLPVNVNELDVSTLAFAGHKIGAVGGVGVLFNKQGTQHDTVDNLPGIVSLAAALKKVVQLENVECLKQLRDYFEAQLRDLAVNVVAQGVQRLCNTSCVRFLNMQGDAVMMSLDIAGIATSTGSACSSGSIEPSPALIAMGYDKEEAKQSVRFSFSKDMTQTQVDTLLAELKKILTRSSAVLE